MNTRKKKLTRPRNNTVKASMKACTYKKSNGSIHVSKYMRCIANDTLNGSPTHIYEINDNAASPFVVFDYGGGRGSIYNNRYAPFYGYY